MKPVRIPVLLAALALLVLPASTNAREGLFLKFSLGYGTWEETGSLDDAGLVVPAKNHAVGWGFNDTVAVFISDFGGLVRARTGDYKFLNLDAFGLGLLLTLPGDWSLGHAEGDGQVALARDWTVATGENPEPSTATNTFLEKEWLLSGNWGFGLGLQRSRFRSRERLYRFESRSLNFAFNYYFTPAR